MTETTIWVNLAVLLTAATLVHISLGLSFYRRVQSSARHRRRLGEMIMPLWLAPGRWAAQMRPPCPHMLIEGLKAISRMAIQDPLKAIKITTVIGWPHYQWRLAQLRIESDAKRG